MNIHASQASHERPGTRQAGTASATPEIKYREDAANYVTAMLAELRQIAGKAGFDKLVKALDAAYYDAYSALDDKARGSAPPPGEGPPENTLKSMEPNGG